MERRYGALGLALEAQKAGMRALVLKSHLYPTAPLAHLVNQIARNIVVLGSLCLDYEVGGLNPAAGALSGEMGAKVVWMPTFSAASWRRSQGEEGGISILDEEGRLLPPVAEIIEIIKKHHMILATGHLSFAETLALIYEAKKRGLAKIVATHASMTFSVSEQQRLAEMGAIIEHCFILALPTIRLLDMATLVRAIKEVGAERCILSTDLGQAQTPPPPEGMRMAIASLLERGLSEEEVEL